MLTGKYMSSHRGSRITNVFVRSLKKTLLVRHFLFEEEIIMAWIYLLIAGIFEVVWATAMKLSNGFSILSYSILTIIGMVISFAGLILASKHLPLSLAYPVWTGIGAVGSIIVGVALFHDHLSPSTWLFVILLVIGLIGIKLTTNH
ncbi:multidrug resistance protein, SMR family [Limosilactobacillus antri DSM 16041]|uniref:Multidrug resistance protein, SMR family n=2 Tax=Limosilactobacillus antri DSM 16041 TaxID=525309 RepID=C8P869_9LACO|nr:multidrug resistance protein, SMR family [Limosilactobacillus antri DSM 16041]